MSLNQPTDRTISVCAATAAALWSLTVLILLAAIVAAALRHEAVGASLMTVSVLLGGVSCVATMRVMLRRHYQAMRNAFDLGRDAGRLESVPTQRAR